MHKYGIHPPKSTEEAYYIDNLADFSTWLDYRMKELLHVAQSYLKDSASFIQEIKRINLPDNALLFTANAKSMYTNIDANIGISFIKNFLISNRVKIPTHFPSNHFLEILEIVMPTLTGYSLPAWLWVPPQHAPMLQ